MEPLSRTANDHIPATAAHPVFDRQAFLTGHVDRTLGFYESHARDPEGGFFHYFKDDGSVYDRHHRHLVSATRFVFNWAQAHRLTGRAPYRDWAAHALAHMERFVVRSGPAKGLHAWTLQGERIDDATAMAYGQAFVLLARAHAHRVGLCTAADVARAFFDVYRLSRKTVVEEIVLRPQGGDL